MPGPATALIENGQVRRIQKQQMERFAAHGAVKEAAEADAM